MNKILFLALSCVITLATYGQNLAKDTLQAPNDSLSVDSHADF